MARSMEKTELEKRLEAELAEEERDLEVGEEAQEVEVEDTLEDEAVPEADEPGDEPGTGAEEPGDETGADAEVVAEPIDVEALVAERDELQDKILRARAEFDNYRRRVARENEQLRKRAAHSLVRDLLPVVDHLELALQHTDNDTGSFIKGVELVLKQFGDVLTNHGVKAIAALGEVFDPNYHEAMMEAASDLHEANVVSQEFQRGYTMGGQVLRAAKVIVSTGPVEEAEEAQSEEASGEATEETEAAENDA